MLRSRSASLCRTLGRSRPRRAGLVPLMGKATVSNITVSLSFVVVSKALAMASLPVMASPLTILPLPPSLFCLLAPYCYTPLPGWHPTAPRRLAPYCYSPAGTILLIVVGWHWHPLCLVAPLATLPSPIVALPRFRPVMVLHCLRDFCQPLRSM